MDKVSINESDVTNLAIAINRLVDKVNDIDKSVPVIERAEGNKVYIKISGVTIAITAEVVR
jgi:hypothetical protein